MTTNQTPASPTAEEREFVRLRLIADSLVGGDESRRFADIVSRAMRAVALKPAAVPAVTDEMVRRMRVAVERVCDLSIDDSCARGMLADIVGGAVPADVEADAREGGKA